MSITVAIEALPTNTFEFYCYEVEQSFSDYTSYEAAKIAATAHQQECDTCSHGVCVSAQVDVDESVNLSNRNAQIVFQAMGLSLGEEDWTGNLPAETVLGAALLALANDKILDNPVSPISEATHAGGVFFVEGFTDEDVRLRLQWIADLATEAMNLGRSITWG